MNTPSIYILPPNPDSAPSPRPSHWNPWVIASVATICIIILLLTYFRIFQNFCCNFSSRNQVGRRLLSETNPDDPSLQFHSHGLDLSIIHAVPITQFKEENGGSEMVHQSNIDCAVCLGEFQEGEWLRRLPNCKHAFHISCIDTWFLSHSNCPLCRSEVYGFALDDHEYPVSKYTLLETLRREDFFQERSAHYQFLRSTILISSVARRESRLGS